MKRSSGHREIAQIQGFGLELAGDFDVVMV